MQIKKHIPNLITLLNLFCGCIAVVSVGYHDFYGAVNFVCLGIFFDYFDGFFARKFGVSGPLGVQLDSLADMVTSGVVPGYVMYAMLSDLNTSLTTVVPSLSFVITLGACYRLANFNIDTRQTDSFIGLPTPANALFILSLPLINMSYNCSDSNETIYNNWILLTITFLSAYIMNAEIPLFSLKIKDFSFKKNALQIVFLSLCVLLLIFFQYLAIPLVIITYVLLSVINNKFLKK